MTTATGLATLHGHKYLSLETFRRNGEGVRTPVWFAPASPGDASSRLYVYSSATAGKVKRIKANAAVRIAPCDIRGKVTGPWIGATARIVGQDDAAEGMRRLGEKYWPWKQILDFFIHFRPGAVRAMIAIEAA